MFSKLFWKDAIERAISTAAQFLVVIGGADGAGFLTADLGQVLILSGLGGAASLLKAIAAYKLTDSNSASLTVDARTR